MSDSIGRPEVTSMATARASSPMWRLSTGDDQIAVLGETGHRQIGLDAAALVQPLGIDDASRLDVDVVGRDAIEHGPGVATLEDEFGEGRLVEQADRIPHRFRLGSG